MEWLTLIISNLVTFVTSLGGTILYFRPKLKEANANAEKAQTDAQDYAYNSLLARINQMEKMYNEQYEVQNKTISDLRKEVLKLSEEKFSNEKVILQLRSRVESLEKEIQAYKGR